MGLIKWPRPWRARNATGRPSSVPTIYASEGFPKGVAMRTSRAFSKPGMV